MTWSTLVKGQRRRHPLSFLRDGSTGVYLTHTHAHTVSVRKRRKKDVCIYLILPALLRYWCQRCRWILIRQTNHIIISIKLKKEKISFIKFLAGIFGNQQMWIKPRKAWGLFKIKIRKWWKRSKRPVSLVNGIERVCVFDRMLGTCDDSLGLFTVSENRLVSIYTVGDVHTL